MEGERVEHIEGVIGVPGSWEVHNETGELVEVLIPGGRGERMKMRKSEAIRLGYLKEEKQEKAQEPKPNKARRQATNKGA